MRVFTQVRPWLLFGDGIYQVDSIFFLLDRITTLLYPTLLFPGGKADPFLFYILLIIITKETDEGED
jgi:hypothetical protein